MRRQRHYRMHGAQNKPLFTGQPRLQLRYKRLLKAQNDFHTGEAIFECDTNIWTCTQADESLSFLTHLSAAKAHVELLVRGYSWTWARISRDHVFTPAGLDRSKGCVPTTPANNTPRQINDQQGIALSATETGAESRAEAGRGLTVSPG